MPYIVTTKRFATDGVHPLGRRPVSRHAVATLEEARGWVDGEIRPKFAAGEVDLSALASLVTESGGTVGPLPDGTVIVVQELTWSAVAFRVGMSATHDGESQILDAWNARHAN